MAPFIPKWEATFRERNGLLDRWRSNVKTDDQPKRVLVHVSSVGELEQIFSVLQEWGGVSDVALYVSYFSPFNSYDQ